MSERFKVSAGTIRNACALDKIMAMFAPKDLGGEDEVAQCASMSAFLQGAAQTACIWP